MFTTCTPRSCSYAYVLLSWCSLCLVFLLRRGAYQAPPSWNKKCITPPKIVTILINIKVKQYSCFIDTIVAATGWKTSFLETWHVSMWRDEGAQQRLDDSSNLLIKHGRHHILRSRVLEKLYLISSQAWIEQLWRKPDLMLDRPLFIQSLNKHKWASQIKTALKHYPQEMDGTLLFQIFQFHNRYNT